MVSEIRHQQEKAHDYDRPSSFLQAHQESQQQALPWASRVLNLSIKICQAGACSDAEIRMLANLPQSWPESRAAASHASMISCSCPCACRANFQLMRRWVHIVQGSRRENGPACTCFINDSSFDGRTMFCRILSLTRNLRRWSSPAMAGSRSAGLK